MSLSAQYQRFRSSPDASALADKASINYIATLVTINEPAAILKHLSAQAKQLNTKQEKVLSAIESDNALCLETETTLEFVSGGGAYLPGLDDNFLADRTVTFPAVHIVQFDAQQKIRQIRLYWDQGSLLKQVDVIGSRARNWPIRDGKDQVRLIASSTSSTSPSTSTAPSRSTAAASKDPNEVTIRSKSHSNGTNSFSTAISPRASAKPPARDLTEILSGGDAPPSPTQIRSPFPQKGGVGKNFQPNRLFDENDPAPTTSSPEKLKTNPLKYSHFEFGDGEDAPKPSTKQDKSIHVPKWDFEDFVTPEKVPTKVRDQDLRNFGWSDDEVASSPEKRPIAHKPRPDAAPHFEFADDGTPSSDRKPATTTAHGRLHNQRLGLYEDHVVGNNDDDYDGARRQNGTSGGGPLKPVTNVNPQARRKDFDAHFEIKDDSPTATRTSRQNGNGHDKSENDENGRVPEEKKQGRNPSHMNTSWDFYEQSPAARKENGNGYKGIVTGGDGMGGRKGTARGWGFGDESGGEGEEEKARRGRVGKVGRNNEVSGDFWEF